MPAGSSASNAELHWRRSARIAEPRTRPRPSSAANAPRRCPVGSSRRRAPPCTRGRVGRDTDLGRRAPARVGPVRRPRGLHAVRRGTRRGGVRETLTRYFELARDVIELYGGIVEKFIGDAVMAVWGAPIAREDDAERAVRAALELIDAVGVLGPRRSRRAPGVMTGEAAVTIGATNQGMVAGDLVNTAARLQSVAPPGSVLVGEATMRAARAAIAFEDAGDQRSRASPRRSPPGVRCASWPSVVAQGRSDLPEPPFVGRDEELRLLKDVIATGARPARRASSRSPAPPASARAGSPGSSRSTSTASPGTSTGTGAAPLVRRRHHVLGAGRDGPRACRAGRSGRRGTPATAPRSGRRVRPATSDRRWVEPALLALLGLETAPPGGRDVLFAAWRIFLERIAERWSRPCSCSRTSNGPTRASWTSSSTCSSGHAACRSSSSPLPARNCSTGVPTGAPAHGTSRARP